MRTLERTWRTRRTTSDALFMAVEWMYNLRRRGAAAHSRAEDVSSRAATPTPTLKAKGPQAALVRQWMEFLEKR